MQFLISSLTFLSLVCPAISMAQNAEPPLVPAARPTGQKATTTQDHLDVEDGGAHGSILESIVVPPKAKSPFTLILETTWVRPLGDGGSITTANKRKITRSSPR